MKYYFSVDGTEFNASEMEIKGVYRMENTQLNLSGGLLIDRIGNEKLTIGVKLNLLTTEQLSVLREARKNLSCTAVFDRGAQRLTKTMHIKEFSEPSPIYLYGSKSAGVRYGALNLELEEM